MRSPKKKNVAADPDKLLNEYGSIESLLQRVLCRLTGEFLKDPVTASDGWTYERKAIENLFKKFGVKALSPVDEERFLNHKLQVDTSAKKILEKYGKSLAAAYELYLIFCNSKGPIVPRKQSFFQVEEARRLRSLMARQSEELKKAEKKLSHLKKEVRTLKAKQQLSESSNNLPQDSVLINQLTKVVVTSGKTEKLKRERAALIMQRYILQYLTLRLLQSVQRRKKQPQRDASQLKLGQYRRLLKEFSQRIESIAARMQTQEENLLRQAKQQTKNAHAVSRRVSKQEKALKKHFIFSREDKTPLFLPNLAWHQQVATMAEEVANEVDAADVKRLLQFAVNGELKKISKLLNKNPKLLLATGEVTDPAGRFFSITVFQYAAWSGDGPLCRLILTGQYLEESIAAVQLKTLEERPLTCSKFGAHYSFDFLLAKTQEYITEYKKLSKDERADFWGNKVGAAQRLCPVWFVSLWRGGGSWENLKSGHSIKRNPESDISWWWAHQKGAGPYGTAVLKGDKKMRSPKNGYLTLLEQSKEGKANRIALEHDIEMIKKVKDQQEKFFQELRDRLYAKLPNRIQVPSTKQETKEKVGIKTGL